MVTTRGFLYIVTGSKFLEEAVESATRLREVHPEANVGVITDSKPDSNLFDDTLLIDDPYRSHKDKVVQVRRSPYDETIFLDSDTHVCSDILDIFSILDQFDFAAAHDSGRRRELYTNDDVLVNAPEAFPMVNSGVMAFCDNQAVDALFELWAQIYDRHNEKQDGIVNQPALREALYRSNVSMIVLPPEYNCRTPFPDELRNPAKCVGYSTRLMKIFVELSMSLI
jgi:hypothetical protein